MIFSDYGNSVRELKLPFWRLLLTCLLWIMETSRFSHFLIYLPFDTTDHGILLEWLQYIVGFILAQILSFQMKKKMLSVNGNPSNLDSYCCGAPQFLVFRLILVIKKYTHFLSSILNCHCHPDQLLIMLKCMAHVAQMKLYLLKWEKCISEFRCKVLGNE